SPSRRSAAPIGTSPCSSARRAAARASSIPCSCAACSCSRNLRPRVAIDAGVSRLELRRDRRVREGPTMRQICGKSALAVALAAFVALLCAPAGVAAQGPAIAPAHGFAPRQVVVKFLGEARGHTVGLPRGAGVIATARALRAKPNVEYAEPNYIA